MHTSFTISDLPSFISIIGNVKSECERDGNNSELLFRGQQQDKQLLPKLARLNLNGEIKSIEVLMLDEFKRSSLPLIEFEPKDNWDWLALAQHHGLPTRLLDWTYNALVALWFVVENSPEKNERGVVWILKTEPSDFRDTEQDTNPLNNKVTKIFRSRVMSRRISAQSGVFTVHRISDKGKVVQFESNATFREKLIKINIPAESFASIRKSLKMMGVNHSTIFPDIDGLCKHLERRFSKLNDEI
jgi:hypothetical protein